MSIRQVIPLLVLLCTTMLLADTQQTVVRISAIEGPRLEVELHPKEVIVLKKGEPPAPVYKGIDGSALAFEVTLDLVEKNDIHSLESLAKRDDKLERPPLLWVTWGNGLKFEGVLESIATKYTMFSPDGTATRATANVRIREAGRASFRGDCSASADCPAGQVCEDPDGDGRKTCVTPPK